MSAERLLIPSNDSLHTPENVESRRRYHFATNVKNMFYLNSSTHSTDKI